MPEAVIVSSVRTPVGRAFKGSLRATRPDDLAALAIKEALARVPGLDAKEIDDVILGCAMPEGEQGMNVARIAALRAGLPVETSAMTINRFCSSGLQAIALAAERIRGGSAEVIVAGGTESMSLVPMGGNKISPNPWLVDHSPDTYISMGLGTENIARKFGITREQADEFSLNSHKKALAGIAAGNFKDETFPVEVKITSTGKVSSLKFPAAMPASAFLCEFNENSSACSRVMPNLRAIFSVPRPMLMYVSGEWSTSQGLGEILLPPMGTRD